MTGARSRDFRFVPESDRLRRLRADVRDAAVELGVPGSADAVSLVVDELVNNAIEHGGSYRRRGEALRLTLSVAQERVALDFFDPEMPAESVLDLARAFKDVGGGLPAVDSERGRGLFLVAIHMEEVRVAVAPGGGLHLHGRLASG